MSKVIRVKNVEIGRGRPKICVSILGGSAEEVLAQAELAESAECDLIEFRADHFDEIMDETRVKSLLRKIRRASAKPVIFTLRRKEEGGRISVPSEYYRHLIRMVSDNSLADIVDVEASAVGTDREFIEELKDTGTYVIVSKHDFSATPSEEEILNDYISMERLGADIVKAAYMPNSKKDVLNLINATEEMTGNVSSCPVIAISMGRTGMVTRIIGEFLESAITFASLKSASAPGQMNVRDMHTILELIHSGYRKIILVGLIGVGKTSVANALSNTFGLNRIDLNAYIEGKEQATISDMADNDMELFLDKETKHLRKVLKGDYQVISAGTGIALRQENIDLIKNNGIMVFLKAEPDTIAERLKNDKSRMMIADVIDMDYLGQIMQNTSETYENVADIKINTDGKTIDEISKEIVETLGFSL